MPIKVNNQPIQQLTFSGGECHVSVASLDIGEQTLVTAKLYSSDDIMSLLMTVDAIRRVNPKTEIKLVIPYFPYARQDRVCNPGEAMSVLVMANLINSLNCESVEIYDPHSEVTPASLNNCKIVSQADLIEGSVVADEIKAQGLRLVAPDKGAKEKTIELSERIEVEAIYCTKLRDPKTGQILETRIPQGVRDQNFIIVDDICDGGGTFIELAKKLKAEGTKKLCLYVTHGIFRNGLEVLKEHFEHIYCYHCFLPTENIDTQFLTVMERN